MNPPGVGGVAKRKKFRKSLRFSCQQTGAFWGPPWGFCLGLPGFLEVLWLFCLFGKKPKVFEKMDGPLPSTRAF